jgi:protein ImuB
LSLDLLPLSEETKRRLELLALRTMGQVAALPRDALVAQFGPEGLLAHEWAGGVDERPLVARAKPASLEEERCCETPVETLDGLVALISDLLDRLVPRLKGRNQVCRQVRLRLDFDDGGSSLAVFTLKAASDSKGEMLGYLERRLDGIYLPSAVTGVGLGLTGLGPGESVQGSFALNGRGEHRQRARQLVGNLKLRWGSNPLKVVAPLDPTSRIPERRARLVDFEP